jgi:hypothetical protein
MCSCKSEGEIEVCTVTAPDIMRTATRLDGVVLATIPETGDVRVTITIPSRRAAFMAAVEDAVAPHYENKGKALPVSR